MRQRAPQRLPEACGAQAGTWRLPSFQHACTAQTRLLIALMHHEKLLADSLALFCSRAREATEWSAAQGQAHLFSANSHRPSAAPGMV